MEKRKTELLAPARDLASGLAAIDHGADAVYIGGPQFGARAAAANCLADIEKLVTAAHRFRARVYVALNTILDDRELVLAERLAWQLQAIGVDALIIQDMGLLEAALPPIPLHASTQTDNRTAEKVLFLEKVGFRQVVLARELSLEQIRRIRAATAVTLEFFVHGALCVCYSGQCYISEVMAGRSANRGECAQFCRHRYTLRDSRGKILEKDRHLLSLKDLELSPHLGALIEAGIDSFKIEGRLKDQTYVKNITAYYRQALDGLIDGDERLQRASSGRCRFPFDPDPAKSFNRGRTDYFLTRKRAAPGAIDSPKSIGELLGPVIRADRRGFTLATDKEVRNGDGLCYKDRAGKLVGIKANRVEGRTIYPRESALPPVGAVVYRNADPWFAKSVAKSQQCRTLMVQLAIKETPDGLSMVITDEDGLVSTTAIRAERQVARRAGAVLATAEKQLKKSGGTLFSVGEVKIELQPHSFYAAAVFNDLRRRGLAEHLAQRLRAYVGEHAPRTVNDYPWPSEGVSYLDNIGNRKAEEFYRRHGIKTIDRSGLRAADAGECALMTCRYCLRAQLAICPKMGGKAVGVAEPLVLADNTGEYRLEFDCVRCEMTVRKGRKSE